MTVLYAIPHVRHYLAGRRFTLITNCSPLTWYYSAAEISAPSFTAGHCNFYSTI